MNTVGYISNKSFYIPFCFEYSLLYFLLGIQGIKTRMYKGVCKKYYQKMTKLYDFESWTTEVIYSVAKLCVNNLGIHKTTKSKLLLTSLALLKNQKIMVNIVNATILLAKFSAIYLEEISKLVNKRFSIFTISHNYILLHFTDTSVVLLA